MRPLATALALITLSLGPAALPGPAAGEDARAVDAALASTRSALVTLSDVTLARASSPAAGPGSAAGPSESVISASAVASGRIRTGSPR